MSLRCCHISIEESFFLLLSAGLDVSFPSLISFFLKKMRILPTFIGFSATCVLAVKGVGFLFRSLRMAVVAVRLFIEPGRFCVTLFSFSFFSRTGGDNPLFTCGPYWVIFFLTEFPTSSVPSASLSSDAFDNGLSGRDASLK